jgi:hypothetical protein
VFFFYEVNDLVRRRPPFGGGHDCGLTGRVVAASAHGVTPLDDDMHGAVHHVLVARRCHGQEPADLRESKRVWAFSSSPPVDEVGALLVSIVHVVSFVV